MPTDLLHRVQKRPIIFGFSLLVIGGGIILLGALIRTRLSAVHFVSVTPDQREEIILTQAFTYLFDAPLRAEQVTIEPSVPLLITSEGRELTVVPEQPLTPDTGYTVTVVYRNQWGLVEKSYQHTFETRGVNEIVRTEPSPNSGEVSLFSPIVARFRYPIDATDIAINLAPPAPFTMSAEDDILRIFPDPYWPSSTRLNISVGPATRAPVEQQFTSTSWAFDTTAIREEAEHYDAVREQEAAQKTEEDLAEEQAKGDLLFVEQITRATENNPKMRVVNMLPLDMGRYKISYRLERDTFVIAYEAVADQQAALQWFEQQGYTPTQIEWIPLDLPPHGFGTP